MNPIPFNDIPAFINYLATQFLPFLGFAAIFSIVFGGFTWITSAGKEDRIKKGQDIVLYAVIGIAVCLSAFIVLKFIINALLTMSDGKVNL